MSATAYMIWFIGMVVVAGAASLGATTWVYFREQHRPEAPRTGTAGESPSADGASAATPSGRADGLHRAA